MIDIQLWENPRFDGTNAKWMAWAEGQLRSGDTALEAVTRVIEALSTADLL